MALWKGFDLTAHNAVRLCAVELMTIAVWRNKRLPGPFFDSFTKDIAHSACQRHVSVCQQRDSLQFNTFPFCDPLVAACIRSSGHYFARLSRISTNESGTGLKSMRNWTV